MHAVLPSWKSSLSFNGSNYLTSPYSTDFNLNSGEFTIDFIMKKTDNSQSQSSVYNGSSNQRGWICGYDPNRLSFIYSTDGAGYTELFSSVVWTPTMGVYHHISFVRMGNVLTMYVDGIQLGTNFAFNVTLFSANTALLVNGYNSAAMASCCISGFRIAKFARWTRNFIPPHKPY